MPPTKPAIRTAPISSPACRARSTRTSGSSRRTSTKAARNSRCDVVGGHHVRFGAIELTDLEADHDFAVETRLREIDAAVGVDRFDEFQVQCVEIARAFRGVAEREERE